MENNGLSAEERRMAPRFPASDPISLKVVDREGKVVITTIADLSFGGFCLKSNDEFAEVGEQVTLTHSIAGEFKGEVMWHRGDQIGVRVIMSSGDREKLLQYTCLALYPDKDIPAQIK
ncbi:PilZ domain-containing protein [Kiloniella laminariae]|uniref:PilZ domain-containing protein n=1 Tax=Kiloniella laminariae TaxID=454162 RepID=A0ABT4LLL0_9PROT|nr:PilZ domain-containing protein [Kiloniella laminariae]MCZ4281988.1 PilZ domain-containing protein [Kiloniella laminariae]